MNNKKNTTIIVKKQKHNIIQWSKKNYIKPILNDLFENLKLNININNYELTLDENIVFNKFISLIYHINII
jgi:hypothetical protein